MRPDRPSRLGVRLWPTGLLLALLAGCADPEIVYRDREPFNPPPDAIHGFLGYYTVASKQTTCGNCHAGLQARWRVSAHADAWATLDANPAKQPFCTGCHTVSERGNSVTASAGYNAVPDSAYRDVQCESCHGPGLEHVEGVGQGRLVRPLARVGITGTADCSECHSGTHHPFADEWEESGHAQVIASPAGRPGCNTCHDGRATLLAWGVESNYVERDVAGAFQPVTCAVCHNPHGSGNPAQLRFAINSPDPQLNLCMKCHLRRDEPEDNRPTPHGPQGGVLLGVAGYRPALFFEYDTARVFGTHATERNPRLCAGCHVGQFTVTDPQSGNFVFSATGHLFKAIPCLDAQGRPVADNSCAYTATTRSWQTCTTAGCHGSAAAAATAFTNARSRLEFLAAALWVDTDRDGVIEPGDQGYLATLKATRPTEWSANQRVTPAEGAEFNVRLCGPGRYANGDKSDGAHNVFLCEALLRASINELRAVYGLPSPPAEAQALLAAPLGGPHAAAVRVSRTPLDE